MMCMNILLLMNVIEKKYMLDKTLKESASSSKMENVSSKTIVNLFINIHLYAHMVVTAEEEIPANILMMRD